MSKIVVLVGSMRKGGNTDLLAQVFIEGVCKNNDIELVSVADCKVNPWAVNTVQNYYRICRAELWKYISRQSYKVFGADFI